MKSEKRANLFGRANTGTPQLAQFVSGARLPKHRGFAVFLNTPNASPEVYVPDFVRLLPTDVWSAPFLSVWVAIRTPRTTTGFAAKSLTVGSKRGKTLIEDPWAIRTNKPRFERQSIPKPKRG